MPTVQDALSSLEDSSLRHIVSVSGGKDSAALAIYMRQQYPQIPVEFVFCDTRCELPETEEYLERLEALLGVAITRVSALDTLRIDDKLKRNPFDIWLELYGGLHGLDRATLRQRIPELLARLGLADKGEVLLKHFSKGMQQRVGIAQAIIADPDLLVFDELSSGLDPVGRFDLREVLLDLKRRGKSIFFSSHELHEVEGLCDRVVMIDHGRKIADENVADLVWRLTHDGAGAGRPLSLEDYFMGLVRPEAVGDVA